MMWRDLFAKMAENLYQNFAVSGWWAPPRPEECDSGVDAPPSFATKVELRAVVESPPPLPGRSPVSLPRVMFPRPYLEVVTHEQHAERNKTNA
jgi:hypothetical protein